MFRNPWAARFGLLVIALSAPVQAQRGIAVPPPGANAPRRGPALGTFGFDTAGMDPTVAPGEDFGRYASGTYLKSLRIPDDRASYGMFIKLRDLSQERTRGILESATRSLAVPGSEERKIGDFYATFMDENAIETKGLAPLRPHLDALAAIQDRAQLCRAFGLAQRLGSGGPVRIEPGQDLKHPEVFGITLAQGGLGLPDRDYYLNEKNPRFQEIRGKYVDHLEALLKLAGQDGTRERAEAVFDLERKLARVHWDRVAMRQRDRIYNPVPWSGLDVKFPGIDWTGMLEAAGVKPRKELIAAHPSALEGIAGLVASEPLATWKDYLVLRLLARTAPCLPHAFVNEEFAFNGTVLSGQPALPARWKRGVDATSHALGEAVGKIYVAKYFPPESKKAADLLVKNVIKAMDGRLSRLAWMDPKTKEAARAKLAAFTPKIGYPTKWRDYTKLEVVRGDALGNALRVAEFQFQRQLDKVDQPIDRSEWGMDPMTVNAYANSTWNEIVFPAAILQPPFFDARADAAVNYGGIGAVIGHEISHHFDDQGRKFDPSGRLADWWTPEDVSRFKALTDKVVRQCAAYEPLRGTHVNGELTLGENMADLAGLNVALDAYHASLGGRKAPTPMRGGFTGDQRFFLGFAQVWRGMYREAALLQQLTTNPHMPDFLRVDMVRNLDAWYEAFGVKKGQALYLAPEARIKVW